MNLAYIAPTKYLNTFSAKGSILLALAHLVDDNGTNVYSRFHRRMSEKGYKVILDNGLFEGEQIDSETLLQRAGAVKAQTVCAPDSLYNSRQTIKAFKEFIRLKQERGMVFDVMGIPQADNPVDWWECFRFMDLSSECHLIGLSILSIPQSFNAFIHREGITDARLFVLQQLYHYETLLGRRTTPCHLLGLGENLADYILASRTLPHTVVSADSSSSFVHGYNEVSFSQLGNIPGGKIKDKLNFHLKDELSKDQKEIIYHNMRVAYQLGNWSDK